VALDPTVQIVNLEPGNYTATLVVDSPAGCSGATVEFAVDPCPDTPRCPTVSFGRANVTVGGCDVDGRRPVSFSGSITPMGQDVVAHISIIRNDSSQEPIYNTAPIFASQGPVVLSEPPVSLSPGDYIAELIIDQPEGCTGARFEFRVDPCPRTVICPSGIIRSVVGDECDKDGNRPVTITADIARNPTGPITARLLDPANPSGPPLAAGNVNSGTLTLVSPTGFALAPGSYVVRVDIDDPSDCPPVIDDLDVPECPTTTTPPPTTTTCDLCCIWFIINIIAVFATLVAFIIAGCVFQWAEPISIGVAVGLAAAATISIILWGIFCNGRSGSSCTPILRWIDILDWLAILAGILAVLVGLTSPCAIAFWINAGFLQWIRIALKTIAQRTGCLPDPWFP